MEFDALIILLFLKQFMINTKHSNFGI